MDQKQFNLFQQVVQVAVDESKRDDVRASSFNMSNWLRLRRYRADGQRVNPRVEPVNVPGYGTMFAIQNASECGTVACLAGTAVLLHGGDQPILYCSDDIASGQVLTEDGRLVTYTERGAELLGMEFNEASLLFNSTELSIRELVGRCERIARRYGHEMEIVW